MTLLEDSRRGALEFVNRARAALGREPIEDLPSGIRASSCQCPVARGVAAGSEYVAVVGSWLVKYPGLSTRDGVLTRRAQVFVEMFDEGRYPELIEEA